MKRRHFLLGLTALGGLASRSHAQDDPWPTRALRILVPGGTGGVIDIRARWIAQRLSGHLQQSVIVENRPGAGGNLGTEMGAHSAPDGYTLTIIHQGTMTVNPHLYARTGYDPLSDFAPITRLGIGPLLLAVHPSLPAGTAGELVQFAKEHPGQLSYGSPGVGTPPHLAVELFKRTTGIDVVHVPYKGGGQAASDLVAGHVQFTSESLNVQLPYVNAGRLRPLAVTGAKRVSTLPGLPTVAEAGWPSYQFEGWVGIAAPALTPRYIVDRLYREIHAIVDAQEGRDWFGTAGAEPGDLPPASFAHAIRVEYTKWAEVVRDAGIRLE